MTATAAKRAKRAGTPRGLRVARLPEGARRLRADPDAAARRGLRDLALLRRRRPRRRQHVRLHRRGRRGVARRDRRGAGRERQGHRDRLPGREGRRRLRARRASERARRHRPARDAGSDGRGPRAPAEAARPVRRPRPAAGDQADPVALRVPQDQRGLQPPLHVLHHSGDARRPRQPSARRGDAGGRESREGRRQGTARRVAGHERVRRGRPLPHGILAGPAGEDADDRARGARCPDWACGCASTTSIRTRTSTT